MGDDLSLRLRLRHIRAEEPPYLRPGRLRRGQERQRGGRVHYLGAQSPRLQQVVTKTVYSGNGKSAAWRKHGDYLEREGAQREGERGEGFDMDSDEVAISQQLAAWQAAEDERLWKIIISPTQAQELDLHEYTRALAGRMEKDLETRLEWVAIDHHNTPHSHVHLIVRGRADDGESLALDRDYWRHGIRYRAQEVATRMLGLRTEEDLNLSLKRQITAQRFTELDQRILAHAEENGPEGRRVSYEGPLPDTPDGRESRQQELARLRVLADMDLARKTGLHTWEVSDKLEESLRQLQVSRDIIRSRALTIDELEHERKRTLGRRL